MTVSQQIQSLIEEQYGNYLPAEMKWMKELHEEIRAEVGDERFLAYLKHVKERHPHPIHQSQYLKV